MIEKHQLFALPFPSTTIEGGGPMLCTDRADLVLSMSFNYEGRSGSVALRFVKQRAIRKRSEIYCTSFHVKDCYDTVCEIPESSWVAELRADTVCGWADRWVMRHFIVYIDSFGCLEVVAESAVLIDESVKNSGGT